MNDKVPATETTDQPDHFAVLAAELHRVADDVATLVGSGLPKPGQFMLNIQPGGRALNRDDDVTAAAVDAMAGALLGIRGEVEKMGDGSYFYSTGGNRNRGPLVVSIYQGVSTEWALKHDVAAAEAELAEREAEAEKARARVAELRAARKQTDPDPTGLLHSRADDADDPTPVSPARVPLHTGGVVDGGQLVDETPGLAPAPIPRHYDTSDGTSVDCACGEVFTGADADALLQRHIAEGNATSPETGERVEVGADGCGCRITEEIRPNGTSIDGTECVEHRERCWARNGGGADYQRHFFSLVDRRAAVEAAHKDALDEDSERRLLAAADTVPVPAEDGTLTPLPESAGSAERMAALQRAKESFA